MGVNIILQKIKRYVWLITVLVTLSIISYHPVYASDEFSPDENGIYHIESSNDWENFLNKVANGEMFSGETVSLDSDLNIEGKNIGFCFFAGTFDGNGHCINYVNKDLSADSAVFPFYLWNANIKNLEIELSECVIDATKQNGSVKVCVLDNAGMGACNIDNIYMHGQIDIIPNPEKDTSIECSGIAEDKSNISNSIIRIYYNLDNDKMDQFLNNTNAYQLRLKLFQFGYTMFPSGGELYSNCYSLGGCSSYFNDKGELFESYYNNKEENMDEEYVIVAPFGGNQEGISSCSVENCYFNNELSAFYIYGCDNSKNYAKAYYFNPQELAKSDADLKKQESFVDYDFENVWGISEYINDGYPYLQSLVSKDLVALVNQITTLPKESEITKDSKETVEKLKEALAGLSDQEKALISFDALSDKVTKAEEAIKAIEEKEKKDSNPQPQEPTTISVKKGTKFAVKGYKYTVTGTTVKNPTVSITGYKNKKLKKITIPVTVTYKGVKFAVTAIGNKAFKGQKKATTATIGTNVTTIGKLAFNGDAKIKKITVKSAVLKKVGAKAFKGIHKKAVIKVPKKQLKAYKKLMKGKGQAKTVKIK